MPCMPTSRSRMQRLLIDALRAVRLESDQPTKMSAALVKGGRILSLACNRGGSTPTTPLSRHAEYRALTRDGDRKAYGATLYVYRQHGKTGQMVLAKPCKRCMAVIQRAGVRRVIYSSPGGWVTLSTAPPTISA